jgi:hypothetical protein
MSYATERYYENVRRTREGLPPLPDNSSSAVDRYVQQVQRIRQANKKAVQPLAQTPPSGAGVLTPQTEQQAPTDTSQYSDQAAASVQAQQQPSGLASLNQGIEQRYQDANAAAMGPVYQGSGTLGQNALPMNTFNGNPFGASTPLGATYSGSGLGPAIGATSPYFQGNAGISFAPLGGYSMPAREPEPGTKGWYAQLGPGQADLLNMMGRVSRAQDYDLADARARLASLSEAANAMGQLRGQQLPYQSNLAQTGAINRGNELDYMASLADVDQRGRQSQDVYNLGMAALGPRQMQAQAALMEAKKTAPLTPVSMKLPGGLELPYSEYSKDPDKWNEMSERVVRMKNAGYGEHSGEEEQNNRRRLPGTENNVR